GQVAQHVNDRTQQPVQAGEGEVRFPLDSRGAEHPTRAAALRGVPQQCRLARPGLTAQHQTAALGAGRELQQPVDRGAFALTANQRPGRPLELRRRHPPIVDPGSTGDRPAIATGEITDALKCSLAEPCSPFPLRRTRMKRMTILAALSAVLAAGIAATATPADAAVSSASIVGGVATLNLDGADDNV